MFFKFYGRTLMVLVMLVLAIPGTSNACNRSFLQLDSIVGNPTNMDVYVTLCIGAGVTGTQKGADAPTRTYAFNFYGAPTLSNLGFSPATVTADTTGITVFGSDVGSFLGSAFSIAYIDPGQVIPFTCVTTTADCGNEHSQCDQYRFTVNEIFDSLRVVGIEGSGNPLAGCYPDQDMLLAFPVLDVDWNYFNVFSEENSVQLEWGIEEHDDGFYEVRRGINADDLKTVTTVEAVSGQIDYRMNDGNLDAGTYFYQVVHITPNGVRSFSEVMSVVIDNANTEFVVYPSVVTNRTSVRFYEVSEGMRTIKVYSNQGQELLRHEIAATSGTNEVELDLSSVPAGVYLVEVRGSQGTQVQRIVRI